MGAADGGRSPVSGGGERSSGRRPISDDEVAHLEAFGEELRRLREDAGLSQRELAKATSYGQGHIHRLEHGYRRPRSLTIERIAAAIVTVDPDMGPAHLIVADLVELAGPAMGQPPIYPASIEQTLARRKREQARMEHYVAMAERKGLVRRIRRP
jgi:transcriptional regulator with XRE-family HTH domain